MAKPRSTAPTPTETGSTKPVNKERVRFIFEPDRHSPNGITFSWLIHKTYGGKEKAATATRAFWLPFAYQENGAYTEAELKDLAQQSIWRLEEQIQHLQEAFGLEASFRHTIAPAPLQQPLPGATGNLQSSTISAPSASPQEAESAQTSLPGTLALVTDGGMLDEFSDAV
ncbi:hypothetical protein [Stenomitos frigidus]|uniref:hypothetical protein n=1 Tax=Stenomitos frigidus TaxID=1886765 RepID=UPI001FE8B6BE|nr:hypothetical protein [Stenomitos frigidus]